MVFYERHCVLSHECQCVPLLGARFVLVKWRLINVFESRVISEMQHHHGAQLRCHDPKDLEPLHQGCAWHFELPVRLPV